MSYVARMKLYFNHMYPLPQRLLGATLLYAAVAVLLCRVAGWPLSLLHPGTCLGIADLFLLALILRLMDELKDLQIDRTLFADRPVPSGLVQVRDIRITLAAVCTGYLVLNAAFPATFWHAVICLTYAFLMFVHFFAPRFLRRHLLLTLATHNPIVPLMISLAAAIAAQSPGHSLSEVPAGSLVALLTLFWLPVLGWELARKIRSREEEDAYVTYSQIFGATPASLLTLAVQSVPFFIGAYWALTLPLSPVFAVVWVAAYAIVVRGHVRFLLRPSPATARLRPIAETYTLLLLFAVVGGHVAAQIWR